MVSSSKHLRKINTNSQTPWKSEEEKTLPNSYYETSITQTQKTDKDITRKENYRSLMNTDAKILRKK